MPVCHEKRVVYVHIPKTGGSTVERALGLYGDYRVADRRRLYGIEEGRALQHLTVREMLEEKYLSAETFESYYSFATVRNPWDRLVSEYAWRQLPKNDYLFPGGVPATFDEFVRSIEPLVHEGRDEHLRPQVDFVCGSEGELLVDFVGMFEDLQGALDLACDAIRQPRRTLERYNTTRHRHYSYYYTDKTRELVQTYFADDIWRFEFTFTPPPKRPLAARIRRLLRLPG